MIKHLGRKVGKGGLGEGKILQETLLALRNLNKDNRFVPKGIYKFQSFEEAEKWKIKMILGNTPDHQP